MALSKKINTNFCGKDIEFDNAYIEIIEINGTKENINIRVATYDSNLKENKIDDKWYNFKPDISDLAKNFIKQGYEYLKTQSDFLNLTDLLDEGQTS